MDIQRTELVKYLDDLLEIRLWDNIDSSLNGLQVEGADRVDKIAFAVDACEQTFQLCAESGAQMLIVHHGLFWGKQLPLTGIHLRRVKLLLDSSISLYAAHLPLDFHPRIGHCACIARGLGLEIRGNLTGDTTGPGAGTLASTAKPMALSDLVAAVDSLLATRSTVLSFGKDLVGKVGIVSGGGSKILDEALSEKIDTFITGESSHTMYHFAREFGVNVIFAGHYATEVPGLKELACNLEGRFSLKTEFISVPTGF